MKEIKAIRYLSLTVLLFSLFYFNIHWLISDAESRVRFYVTSTAFEFLLLGVLLYQYSKLLRDRLSKAVACLFMIFALGNYLDELMGKTLSIGSNEVVFGILGIILVIARFYKEWHSFILKKILPLGFLTVVLYLVTRDSILTFTAIILSSTLYALWILIYNKPSKK